MNKEINKKFKQLSKLIGNTPLIEIKYSFMGKTKKLYAKLEWFNLTGSVKDRPALQIIKDAYALGQLKPKQTICETTSGNMGISLAAIAKFLNNPIVVCMPKNMSTERKKLLECYGAKLMLTSNFSTAFSLAEKFKKMGAYLPYQFKNKSNCVAHYKTTAKEIASKLKHIPCFVGGVGTGGTLIGIGSYLNKNFKTKIIAVDPAEAALLKTGKPQGKHSIQGLSDGIIPKLYNSKIVNQIVEVNSNDAIFMAQQLCQKLGLGVGISSGANFLGCVFSKTNKAVTIFADDNKKYLSTSLTKKVKPSKLVKQIKLISYKYV